MADTTFKAIPFENLNTATRSVIEANAKSQGLTPEQYYESRGGVNKSGYYGDAYQAAEQSSRPYLTEEEYSAALEGKTGTARGIAINIATAKKAFDAAKARGLSDEAATIASGFNPYTGETATIVEVINPKTGNPEIVFTRGDSYVFSDGSTVKINNATVAKNPYSNLSSSSSSTQTDAQTLQRRTAQQEFRAVLGELGLADLADEVDRMIREDKTVSQIKLELPKTEAYKTRFPGMETLKTAGRAISEATYISNERGYLQTLRAYGLDTNVLGSRSALGTYIANEVSPREFEERVNIAATRVDNNPEVLETFKSFYPEVDKSGVITYLLNPKAGMAIIKKQVRTSEIGAAAASAGFARDLMGISNIETLLPAVGETAYAGLRTEFQRARQLAQSQRRLAQIEGQQYSDLEAIGAVVGDDTAKILASERRAQREAARFSARGGVTGASLAGPTAI